MFDFRNKSVLVTGGSRGIGKAVAALFAQYGADVGIVFKNNSAEAENAVNQLQEYIGKIIALQGDLGQEENADSVMKLAANEFGKIDILVNNAGIWKYSPIREMSGADLSETLDINVKSYFYCVRYALPFMPENGNIINISSTAGQRGEAFYSHYAASKGAVISFTKSLAAELVNEGIRVNCVAPGWVDTDMTSEALSGERKEEIFSAIPMGRPAIPQEIAGPVLFLASDFARYVNGEILNVNGGSVLCG